MNKMSGCNVEISVRVSVILENRILERPFSNT